MRMKKLALAAAMVSASFLAIGARADEQSVVSLDGLKLATPTAEQKDALNQLPEALRPYYTGYWLLAKIGQNPTRTGPHQRAHGNSATTIPIKATVGAKTRSTNTK